MLRHHAEDVPDRKLNCWEFMKCGRELGGGKSRPDTICPASYGLTFDGIHGGTSAGRVCWVVSGTRCGGELQGSFWQKYRMCSSCDFYTYVKSEEGNGMVPTTHLLKMLK